MTSKWRWTCRLVVCLTVTVATTLTVAGSASAAEILWGLTANNTLVRFSSSAPGTILATLPITGLAHDERIVVIEVDLPGGRWAVDDPMPAVFRARLTGVSNAGRYYEISRTTGAATELGPVQPVSALSGSSFGAADTNSRLTIVSETSIVKSIDKPSGLVSTNSAPANRFVALAYGYPGQPRPGSVAIDSAADALYEVFSGRPSLLGPVTYPVYTSVPIGPLGVDTSDDAGLEFGPHDRQLYAALTVGGVPGLYTVNPASGHATLVGFIPAPPIISLTADAQGTPEITPSTLEVLESDTTLTFTVRRTGDNLVPADYSLTTIADDPFTPAATSGEDFESVSGTLHFAVGEVEKTATVTIRADAIREAGGERFRLMVTETAPDQLVFGNAMITILDDDNQPPVLTVSSPSSPVVRVSTPTIAVTGLASDEDPGAVIKLFGAIGIPFAPIATTTASPWSFADVPLNPGVNSFTVTVEDIHGATTTRTFSVIRETAGDLTYVFAEGATGPFFTTDLLFANPHATNVWLTIDFLREDGTVITHLLNLPAQRRTTLTVNTVPGLEATATAAVVRTAGAFPIVVERTMRWDASGYGASTEKAAADLSRTWYFAEGSQGAFFSTFLLLVNPRDTPNDVTVRFLREGAGPIAKTYNMLPRQRLTIDAGSVPELVASSFGIEVNFTDPGMAERSMYFGTHALWDGGHESAGATAPATEWLLAEGATGAFFETFVLVANPSSDPAEVTMTYLPEGGASVTRTHSVPANSRLTVNIEQEDSSLANVGAVGTRLTSTVPVVVERSQYWPFSPAEWYEAHNSFGETAAAKHWGLAEGRVGGAAATRTYILMTNPDPAATAHVSVTFLREGQGVGTAPVMKAFDVAPASRLTIDVGSAQVPEITDGAFGADIVSDVPIAVERAMYSNANGQVWAAGTNAAATRLP